jgi:hypothetical protein
MVVNKLQYFVFYCLLVIAFAGCNLDYFDGERFALESYPSTFAVPVMKGSLS